MTLSLDDVRNKRFRMARKGGYEVLEVDEFVDEVEESFGQVVEENTNLKKQLDALRSGGASDTSSSEPAPSATQPDEPVAPSVPAQAEAPQPVAQPVSPPSSATAAEPERIVVTASAEASTAVVRLVQLSTEQAEHLVREASAEAGQIRDDAKRSAQQVTEDARTRADRVESEARVNAERLQSEAKNRSDSLDRDLVQRRTDLFGDLDRQRDSLTETVARLREFEQRYRSSLSDHLHSQIETLDRVGLEPDGGPERSAPQGSSGATSVQRSADHGAQGGADPTTTYVGNGQASTATSGPSDTPRLDALLGEQR